MALELRDLRAKVSIETDIALEAVSRATGKEKAEVARTVLHDWALQRLSEARVLTRLLKGEGLRRAHEGEAGTTQGESGT